MAKDNIYDLIISELILRLSASTGVTGAPTLKITSSLGSLEVPASFSGNAIFTSTITNIPTGYTVKANSHVITTPTVPVTTTGSTNPLDTVSHSVVLGVVGSTFVVTSTVTLEKSGEADIILNDTHTITAVLPIYYGVKAYSATPDDSGLSEIAMSATSFQMTSSSVGRIVIGLPISLPSLVSITDSNGNLYTIANDFSVIVNGSYNYYQLNYDTQLTGTNVKTFTLNFS